MNTQIDYHSQTNYQTIYSNETLQSQFHKQNSKLLNLTSIYKWKKILFKKKKKKVIIKTIEAKKNKIKKNKLLYKHKATNI